MIEFNKTRGSFLCHIIVEFLFSNFSAFLQCFQPFILPLFLIIRNQGIVFFAVSGQFRIKQNVHQRDSCVALLDFPKCSLLNSFLFCTRQFHIFLIFFSKIAFVSFFDNLSGLKFHLVISSPSKD
jgi:hypothetical protein